jgi:hypothetical protein
MGVELDLLFYRPVVEEMPFKAPGNYLRKRLGIENSPPRFYEDILRAGIDF